MKTRLINFLKQYWLLLVIIMAKFILQYVLVNPYYELHRDEFLHLDQANHPAFGFISVPPLTSIISKLIFLFGGGEFWVRFFPALTGALTIIVCWLMVERLGGKILSKLLVSLALLFSVFLRINMLFQPNSVDILVWSLLFYSLIGYFQNPSGKWLYYLALIITIGFYNKYNVIFLLIAVGAGLLLTRSRKIFTGRFFIKALLLTLLLIIPNIIWQIVNDFPLLNHMRVLSSEQLVNNSAGGFLKSQITIFLGSFPLVITGLLALFIFKQFRPFRFFAISFIIIMAIFALLKAKNYYALGIFPVIIVFASIFLERVLKPLWKTIVFSALIMFNLLVTVTVIRFLMPCMSPEMIVTNSSYFEKFGMLRWEDGKNHPLPQDFSDMTGWKEMADKALEAYRLIPENELENTLVFCHNYGQAGALNYFNKGKMKEAYSLNTDYIYWIPEKADIKNVVLVGDNVDDDIAKMFGSYKQTGIIENKYARENGTGIYLLTGASPAFSDFFYKEIERRKKEHDIF